MIRWMRIFALTLCVCVMLLCGYMIYEKYPAANRGNSLYEDVQSMAVIIPDEAERDNVTGPVLPHVDFEALGETNPDITAWIYSPDTPVNYPVVQGQDNQYYLKRLFDNSYNTSGSIFLDARNTPDFSDGNSVIYGHHMKTEAMFSSIEGYKEQSYYEEHPVIYLIAPDAVYRVELFAGIVLTASDIPLSFEDSRERAEYISSLRESSTFDSAVEVGEQDRLLTLSTCVYDFEDARYMLTGKLVQLPL